MTQEAISILKKRLANGEISLDQYEKLLTTIANPIAVSIDVGSVIDTLDDLQICTKGLARHGKKYLYGDIFSVHCFSHDGRMNGISFVRNSHLAIIFKNNDSFDFDEDGRFFKGNRHKKIIQIGQFLKDKTREIRQENFTNELITSGSISIGITDDRHEVFLSRNGDIECPSKNIKLHIKDCHSSGTLALGVEKSTLNSNAIDTNLIVISNMKRSLLNFPKDSLRFTLSEPTDVAMAYLKLFQSKDFI
jgi:hypothetical protein